MDQGAQRSQACDPHRCIPSVAGGGLPARPAEIRFHPGGRRLSVRHDEARHHTYWRSRLSLAGDLPTPPPTVLRHGTLSSHGRLLCSSSRTIAVRRPNGPTPAATPSRPICGHDHAPRMRGMIANSIPIRPTTRCPPHALAMPAARPRFDVSTWAKSVAAHFSDDP
jgi:hypothetical protein